MDDSQVLLFPMHRQMCNTCGQKLIQVVKRMGQKEVVQQVIRDLCAQRLAMLILVGKCKSSEFKIDNKLLSEANDRIASLREKCDLGEKLLLAAKVPSLAMIRTYLDDAARDYRSSLPTRAILGRRCKL